MAPDQTDQAQRLLDRYGGLECPIWTGLDDQDKISIFQAARLQNVPRRHIIFHAGDTARGFYIVLEGAVKIFKLSHEGQEQILFVAGAADTFAEAAVFSGEDYPASAQALEESALLFIPKDKFRRLLKQNPEMSLKMLAGISQWLRRMVQRFENVTLADAETRLALYLVDLAEREKPLVDGARLVELPIKKNVLASLLTIRDATLSRLLAKFEQEGLITINGRTIRILQFDKLKTFQP